MFAFQQKSLLCTEGQRAWTFLVRGWLGRQREIFKHRTTRKKRAPSQDERQSPGRAVSWVLWGGHLLGGAALLAFHEVLGLAPDVLRVTFTAVVVINDNIDDKYHQRGSLTLISSSTARPETSPHQGSLIPTYR